MSGVLDSDFPWTEEQKEVIKHEEGPLQVIACAGSGKTHTVAARIAQLVHKGVDRDKILAFTFTENAAEELKVRIREWLQKADLDDESFGDMYVNTIHGFCQDTLNNNNHDTLSYDVLSENEVSAFISKHYWDLGLAEIDPRHSEAKYKKIDWFLEDVDTMRRERIVEDVRNSEGEYADELINMYETYQDLMENFHFFDYQELIYRCLQMLEENPDILSSIQEEYDYIVVDEYQDVNKAQEELVKLLTQENKNLCVVGDDDQSIYGFRGARPEIFRNFDAEYDADTAIISKNFRSTELIVDLAQGAIANNNNRIEKPMESDRDFDIGDVYQHYFDHERDEISFIADRIEELHGTVYNNTKGEERTLRYGDVGILSRKKRHLENIQDELERRDIPYTIRGRNSLFAHPVANFIRLAFAYIARGQEADPEARLSEPVQIWDSDTPRPGSYDDDTEYYAVTESDIRLSIQNNSYLSDREDTIVEQLNEIQEWYENPTSRRIEPQTELHKILEAMGMGDLPADDVGGDYEAYSEPVMYNIGQVSELIKDFETVYEIIFPDQITELVDFLDYSYYNAKFKIEDDTLVNAVDLLTLHSAKGLEYPCVFMPGLTKQKFDQTPARQWLRHQEWLPESIFDYDQYQSDQEEERRLFYVGLTRTQKYLCLTGATQNIGYSQNQSESDYYDEVDALNHPGVLYEPEPDPTPREPKDLPGGTQDYVFPTSFSDIRYYQKCPYDYKLRKVYGFAPPIDQAFGFGFAVHDLLREMHERHELDEQQMVMSPGEIQRRVRDEDRFHLRYASGTIDENLRNAAGEMLISYSQDYQDDLINTYRPEVPFEILITDEDSDGAALVSGEIDLLERRNPQTNEVEEVDIIDFKTSDEPDDEPEKMRDNRFQVLLYGLATRAEFDLEAVDGYIHYLGEEDEERIDVDLSDFRIEQVRKLVKSQVDKIMQRRFFADPDEEKCDGCDFENICPHAASR